MNLVELILHRTFDTPAIRIAARTLAGGLLFLVLMGAVSRAETGHAAAEELHAAPEEPHAEAASDHAAHDAVAESVQAHAAPVAAPEHSAAGEVSEEVVDEHVEAGQAHGSLHQGPVNGYTREERLLHRLKYFSKYGIDAWERGDHEEAELAFARALNVNLPAEYKRDLLWQMAELYEKDEQPAKAIAALEKLYVSDPDHEDIPEALLKLGILYRDTGAFDLARRRLFQVLNSTLAVSSDSFDENRRIAMKARLEIAETYAMQGNFEEARRYYSRLQRLDLPESDLERVIFREAQLQYQLENWVESEKQFGAFLEEYPKSRYAGEARYLRAKALEVLERRDEALAEVVTLLSSTPAEPSQAAELAYWQRRSGNELANQFYEQGDFHGALSIYQALARASADPEWRWPALYQIGLCFERLNLPQRAGEAYQLIVSPEEAAEEGATGENAPVEVASDALKALQEMAQWRLDHLDWIEDFENRVHVLTAKPSA